MPNNIWLLKHYDDDEVVSYFTDFNEGLDRMFKLVREMQENDEAPLRELCIRKHLDEFNNDIHVLAEIQEQKGTHITYGHYYYLQEVTHG